MKHQNNGCAVMPRYVKNEGCSFLSFRFSIYQFLFKVFSFLYSSTKLLTLVLMKHHLLYGAMLLFFFFNPTVHAQDTCDGYLVWDPPIMLSDGTGSLTGPVIAITGRDTIHVTFRGNPLHSRLPYRRSVTNGRTWEPLQDLITDTVEFPIGYTNTTVVAEGLNVYVFGNGEYISEFGWPRENVMVKSTDRGTTWSSPRRFGPDSAGGLWSASISGDTLIVVYSAFRNHFGKETREIYSTDGGERWTRTNDTLDSWTRTALFPGTFHAVRETSINWADEKLYLRSYDLGNTFPHRELLSSIDGRNSFEHDLASAIVGKDTTLMLVWRETKYGCVGGFGCSIALRESRDNGNTWLPEEILTEQPEGANPEADIYRDGTVGVTWDKATTILDAEVVLRVRYADGRWTPRLSGGHGGIVNIAVSANTVHTVWAIDTDSLHGTLQIFYRRGVFKENTMRIYYPTGWNLVSVPFAYSSVTNLPSLFSFDHGYLSEDSMEFGKGYWAKIESSVRYEGDIVLNDTINVTTGWNVIGALTKPIGVNTIQSLPDSIVTSSYFGYDGGAYFTADSLRPASGYWVKVKQNGKLILRASTNRQ
ncbi:MAG: exo-alpha-sialidase [Ignavibacteriae bacterium]|nr:exo-alpha-sialidase [Ignavibacteriota bacterium]